MKKSIVFLLMLFSMLSVVAQEIQPPTEGKAVVYFVRTSSLGFAINFSYFHNEKFIGKFNGPKYLRYECEPGEQLFWAKSENHDFILAELEADRVYFIEAVPRMGGVKAQVQLIPINPSDTKQMDKVFKLMGKKSAEEFTDDELNSENEKLKAVIAKGMERYTQHTEKGKVERLEKTSFYEKK